MKRAIIRRSIVAGLSFKYWPSYSDNCDPNWTPPDIRYLFINYVLQAKKKIQKINKEMCIICVIKNLIK